MEEEEKGLSRHEIEGIMASLLEQERGNERDSELICGAVMLAEEDVKARKYRRIREYAVLVRDILDSNKEIDEVALEVLPRMIDAVEFTAYSHLLRDLLAQLIIIAHGYGEDMEDYRHEAETLVKLDILLEPSVIREPEDELQSVLASMFTSQQLLKLIANPIIGHLNCDPVEYTWEWEYIFYDVADELDAMFANEQRGMGFCFKYWSKKKELLKKKYGINWRTPHEMNPRVMFD